MTVCVWPVLCTRRKRTLWNLAKGLTVQVGWSPITPGKNHLVKICWNTSAGSHEPVVVWQETIQSPVFSWGDGDWRSSPGTLFRAVWRPGDFTAGWGHTDLWGSTDCLRLGHLYNMVPATLCWLLPMHFRAMGKVQEILHILLGIDYKWPVGSQCQQGESRKVIIWMNRWRKHLGTDPEIFGPAGKRLWKVLVLDFLPEMFFVMTL